MLAGGNPKQGHRNSQESERPGSQPFSRGFEGRMGKFGGEIKHLCRWGCGSWLMVCFNTEF